MKYAIGSLRYHGGKIDGNEFMYKKLMYLGVEGMYRVYVYQEKPDKETLFFDSKEDANDYIKAHKLNIKTKNIGGEKHKAIAVEFY